MNGDEARPAKIDMPLTDFIVALFKMTPEQRQAASAERAVERYGIPLDLAQWWIQEARRDAQSWPIRGGGK